MDFTPVPLVICQAWWHWGPCRTITAAPLLLTQWPVLSVCRSTVVQSLKRKIPVFPGITFLDESLGICIMTVTCRRSSCNYCNYITGWQLLSAHTEESKLANTDVWCSVMLQLLARYNHSRQSRLNIILLYQKYKKNISGPFFIIINITLLESAHSSWSCQTLSKQ